jgi:DNA uptake protein ComE-like DNA-binding protein
MSTPFKSFFLFHSAQRLSLIFLLSLVILLQLLYAFVDFRPKEIPSAEKSQWLALQSEVDSLKSAAKNAKPKIYPFNPNFITDFKGYKLGMSVTEIDRLLAFRKQNLYVNSAEEFQQITKVSDSLLAEIAPYFKFPDWVKNRKDFHKANFPYASAEKKKPVIIKDINQATQQDLMDVYGIGPALSERILKEKEKLGGFVSMEQMDFIWGLSPEVIDKLKLSFKIVALPAIKKVLINTAAIKELSKVPYLNYYSAKAIVTFRSMNGEIRNTEDLAKIKDFPVEKLKIIALYLEF